MTYVSFVTQIETNVLSLFHLWRENFGQSVCIKRPRSSQRLQFFQYDIRCLSFRQSTAQMLSTAHLFIFSVLIESMSLTLVDVGLSI